MEVTRLEGLASRHTTSSARTGQKPLITPRVVMAAGAGPPATNIPGGAPGLSGKTEVSERLPRDVVNKFRGVALSHHDAHHRKHKRIAGAESASPTSLTAQKRTSASKFGPPPPVSSDEIEESVLARDACLVPMKVEVTK